MESDSESVLRRRQMICGWSRPWLLSFPLDQSHRVDRFRLAPSLSGRQRSSRGSGKLMSSWDHQHHTRFVAVGSASSLLHATDSLSVLRGSPRDSGNVYKNCNCIDVDERTGDQITWIRIRRWSCVNSGPIKNEIKSGDKRWRWPWNSVCLSFVIGGSRLTDWAPGKVIVASGKINIIVIICVI